jgi:hypothetical protein
VSLEGALVDRARILRSLPLPLKVDGSTQFSTSLGAWFPVRLTLASQAKADDGSSENERVTVVGSLLMLAVDGSGEPIALDSEDEIEVESEDLGRAVWRLTGDPAPLRRREGLLGFSVPVQRVATHDFEAARA